MSPLDRVEVFYGECSPATAHVYVRVPDVRHDDGWSMAVAVRGPECLLAHTLPATVRGSDMGPGDGLLARVVLPDPCYWSPQLPALYQVNVELHQHGDDVDAVQREFGLRLFGPRGKSLYLDGRRCVPRGVSRQAIAPAELGQWREADAVMLVREPDDALCEAASQQGVMLIAVLDGDGDHVGGELARLSRHAAVAMAAISTIELDGAAWRRAAPNVLLAASFHGEQAVEAPSWAQALVVEVRNPASFGARVQPFSGPVLAYRPLASQASLTEARQACDHLQRDLAPDDFAGYLV